MRLNTGAGAITSVSFNDDLSCLACATDDGYGIFLTMPLVRYCFRSFAGGGFSIVEMFGQSNVLALVGGRPSPPGFSESSVVLWDDAQGVRLWELQLYSPITALCCRQGVMAVVMDQKVAVYRLSPDFSAVEFDRSFDTVANPRGLCSISHATSRSMQVLAMPGPREGSVRVLVGRRGAGQDPTTLGAGAADGKRGYADGAQAGQRGGSRHAVPGDGGPGPSSWSSKLQEDVHRHPLACLALNRDGSYLATASKSGELIRLWGAHQASALVLVREFRRGTTVADIFCISFSPASDILCCSSDSGTVHLFSLHSQTDAAAGSSLLMQAVSSVQGGQRGFAQVGVECSGPILCGLGAVGQGATGPGGQGAGMEGSVRKACPLLVVTAAGQLVAYHVALQASDAATACQLRSRKKLIVEPFDSISDDEFRSSDEEDA